MNDNDLMKKEWDLAWEHVKNVSGVYWKLFLSIIALNGVVGNYYFNKVNSKSNSIFSFEDYFDCSSYFECLDWQSKENI